MAAPLLWAGVERDAGRRACFGAGMRDVNRTWGFDDHERGVLMTLTKDAPELRAVVERAAQRADLGGMWVANTTVKELDDIYTAVETAMHATRSERRRDVLEALIAGLCTAMDGF